MRMTLLRKKAESIANGAFLQTDRGSALYITKCNSDAAFIEAGFLVDKRHGITLLTPCEALLQESFSAYRWKFSDDPLQKRLLRHAECGSTIDETAFCLEMIKKYENNAPFSENCEIRLRQLEALSLRIGTGGGCLWIAGLMLKGDLDT